ncbi:uncharacterized protein Z518_11342 [Rhinocladiella mackenziei CBS 650.93]|uniref:histone acetyltransferase n=1 Tax=Rhinocladiella mackenziei CBS 650.93 TaxID=1442369 RepID=A0A0D2IRG9_9EURO|nr:uncharacterized protein Z518_11342 [Rhinocladiella mackenziei CBS 650.93]KIW99354.1 hypothetical protein Z518_11342 [Rhinocladiella mackenziei CBS 650.93]
MPPQSSLQSRLAAVIPAGINLQAYHLSTTPEPTAPLFSSLPGQHDEATFCESHFLAISSPENDDGKEILVFAIEVFIFATTSVTTLFVSKADSSGFSSRLRAPKGSPSIVALITSTFLDFLLEPRLTNPRVVLSLFARSQIQYLFPGSIENAGKHVLDDRQLIKWWCRILDRVRRNHEGNTLQPCQTSAHLVVPGCDKGETKAFFPPSSRQDSISDSKWINSYPVELLVEDSSVPPRYLIPRLPDDPKSRFLDDLDGDYIDEGGKWRSIKSLDQFWEMMSYRQECSAGRLVGFVWVVFSYGKAAHASSRTRVQSSQTESGQPHLQSSLLTPNNSELQRNGTTASDALPEPDPRIIPKLNSPPQSSPVGPGQIDTLAIPSDGEQVDAAVASTNQSTSTMSVPYLETRGEVVMDANQYTSLMDFLLQTDFAGEELAAASTAGWVQKVFELSRVTTFGRPIRGEHILAQSSVPENKSSQPVNVLTSIRKKRKADNWEESVSAAEGAEVSKKKPKN